MHFSGNQGGRSLQMTSLGKEFLLQWRATPRDGSPTAIIAPLIISSRIVRQMSSVRLLVNLFRILGVTFALYYVRA